jgi:hypothetical protein
MGGTSGPPPPVITTTTNTTTNITTNTIVGQNASFSGTYSSGTLTSINSNSIIIGSNSSGITINGNLTIADSLINLAPSGLTNDVNSGIYININTKTTTRPAKYTGLIRQNNTDNTLGSSYWYLFDSNEVNSSGDCPKLTTDNAVGAILQVGTILSTSDERLKVNIETIENTLESISNLRGVRYDWKDGHGRKEIGVIAQDIEKEYPELIHKDDSGYLTVDYPKLSGVLIEGIKGLNKKIDCLESRLKKLEEKPK